MKKPNGYGSIFKLSGKRRKPWAILAPAKYDENGKSKRIYLGYFQTRKEAEIELAKINETGIDAAIYNITFEKLYEKWSKDKYEQLSKSGTEMYKISYGYSKNLHEMQMKDIRVKDMEECIKNCPAGISTKRRIRTLYRELYKFALKHCFISGTNYASLVDLPPISEEELKNKATRKIFTDEEIETLWQNISFPYIDTILILIYSGWRIGELLDLKKEDIDLNTGTMFGGSKTVAGKNRLVPIHSKIIPLVEKRMQTNGEYFITNFKDKKINYSNFRREKWDTIMLRFKMSHTPHEARHTTASLLDRFGANKKSIQLILGHASKDITSKVYIHKNIEELRKAIELINL